MNNQINAQIIFSYIKDNNLSKTAFCKKCKISIKTFKKITNGQNVKIVSIFKIAHQTNIPVCYLFKQS